MARHQILAFPPLNRNLVSRGAQLFEPSPSELEPRRPFLRNDRDEVGQARPSGDAALLHEDQPEQAALTKRVLDGGALDARLRGERVDREDADAGALNLPSNNRQGGGLAGRERCGDLCGDDPAHGLASATLDAGLSIWRPGASSGGARKPVGGPWRRLGQYGMRFPSRKPP